MSSLNDYNLKLAEIKNIKDEDIKNPNNIPVDVYIQEAESLYHWAMKDKEELKARGFKDNIIDDLPIRCGALREAESRWAAIRFNKEDSQKEWMERYPKAYELRNEILHNLRFAYRKSPDIINRLSLIAEGSGHADMLQDLNDLAVLGSENPIQLKEIEFNINLLEEASKLSKELSQVLGKASSEQAIASEVKKIRDQSYTYLKYSVDQIREYGQFVFWKNEERLKGYKSAYITKKNTGRNVKKSETNGKKGETNTLKVDTK